VVMFSSSQLPQWVSYFQALGIPVAALIVTLLGVWIAARQMLIADEKVWLDSFNSQWERRFAVYESTRSILEKCTREKISEADAHIYGLRALEGLFLFGDDDDVYKYLQDVHYHVSKLAHAESKSGIESEEERAKYRDMALGHMDWIKGQGFDDQTGIGRFEPFLKYAAPTRPWLLQWP
jgi:hypothetical protein